MGNHIQHGNVGRGIHWYWSCMENVLHYWWLLSLWGRSDSPPKYGNPLLGRLYLRSCACVADFYMNGRFLKKNVCVVLICVCFLHANACTVMPYTRLLLDRGSILDQFTYLLLLVRKSASYCYARDRSTRCDTGRNRPAWYGTCRDHNF